MRPTGLELLRGVRTLLLEEVLPELTAPHLRMQLGLAIGMLAAAAAELDDAPAAYAEERGRALALAAEALPLLREHALDESLAGELEALLAAPEPPAARPVTALEAESARLLDLLDRLLARCDARNDGDAALAALADRLDAELHARIDRRLAWGGGVR